MPRGTRQKSQSFGFGSINLLGGHCVLYRVHARPEPTDATEAGEKNRTPNPAFDCAHVIPPLPDLDCGLKALSEVRRPEAAPAAISQTFRVNARNLLSSDRFTNFRN